MSSQFDSQNSSPSCTECTNSRVRRIDPRPRKIPAFQDRSTDLGQVAQCKSRGRDSSNMYRRKIHAGDFVRRHSDDDGGRARQTRMLPVGPVECKRLKAGTDLTTDILGAQIILSLLRTESSLASDRSRLERVVLQAAKDLNFPRALSALSMQDGPPKRPKTLAPRIDKPGQGLQPIKSGFLQESPPSTVYELHADFVRLKLCV